ncbi:hypothetical protein DO73_5014 [Burkholderia pseudomallei]|nr:hypothetical protein DO73_5014 [Burkholderia pseudomallei]
MAFMEKRGRVPIGGRRVEERRSRRETGAARSGRQARCARSRHRAQKRYGLQRLDVGSLEAFRAPLRLEAHLLVLGQRLVSLTADFREMREQIVAARIRRDEAKTLGLVEPLDGTGIHKNP